MADAKPKVPPSAVKKKKPNNKASQIYYALGAAGAALLLLILVGLLKRPVIERPPRGPGQRQAPQNAPQQQQQGDAPGAENSWPWGEGTYWTKEITKEGGSEFKGPHLRQSDALSLVLLSFDAFK